ncbi:MAG TPA: hypothetical protein VHD95_01385 [Rhizomicrobium sp.]|jgi:hypothetical protein|nr:hypothetical protein [Rhizomicrobium sp.]
MHEKLGAIFWNGSQKIALQTNYEACFSVAKIALVELVYLLLEWPDGLTQIVGPLVCSFRLGGQSLQ